MAKYCVIYFAMIRVPVRVFRNSYSPFMWVLSRFGIEWGKVITISGGLPDFLGVYYSDSVYSALVVSVSISIVQRCAKKLRVNTALGGILRFAGIGTGLVDFLAEPEVLLLWSIIRDMPLASVYFLEVVMGRWFQRFCLLHHSVLLAHSPTGRPTGHVLQRTYRNKR
jgi:hypothetical protein